MLGQGATEYLVLLAVVLIVALVSVALLGFFPGMASDAQMTQSQAYWQSASPIAITEWAASYATWATYPYLRIKNNGAYPVRITKILGGGHYISQVNVGGATNMSDYYHMAPGEEKYFGTLGRFGLPADRDIQFIKGASSGSTFYLYSAASTCSAAGQGILQVNDFGFEYIEYIDGQQITKRQVGKPIIIKCTS